MPATLMAADASPWTALAASRQVNEPDIENTEQYYDYGYDDDDVYDDDWMMMIMMMTGL